jgi:hypothetical protein
MCKVDRTSFITHSFEARHNGQQLLLALAEARTMQSIQALIAFTSSNAQLDKVSRHMILETQAAVPTSKALALHS